MTMRGSYGFLFFCVLWALGAVGLNRGQLRMQISERTRQIFERMDATAETGGAGGSSSLRGLEAIDANWERLRNGGWKAEPSTIVYENLETTLPTIGRELYDVAISGGTLGIFYAQALQAQGKKVVVVERGKVQGRAQEWNISRKELSALLRAGVVTAEELESCVSIEFNPVRVGFKTDTSYTGDDPKLRGFELYTRDVLNLGLAPDLLIALVRAKFIAGGGAVLEEAALTRIDVHANCAALSLASGQSVLARLVLDCMGNASPIGKQIRGPVQPDGVCIVVGSCARGFSAENNTYSDLIYTDTPVTHMASSDLQFFWEAFPTGSGLQDRTTYLFAYMDASPERPSVAALFDEYWKLLPRYQGVGVDELQVQRILYGVFPTYRASPLRTTLSRVLQVGDASGVQSPLSFGGFGSLTRHLERIVSAACEALDDPDPRAALLQADCLALINAYQPNLSACWMFQRSMSVPVSRTRKAPPDQVVGTLQNSFSAMEALGEVCALLSPPSSSSSSSLFFPSSFLSTCVRTCKVMAPCVCKCPTSLHIHSSMFNTPHPPSSRPPPLPSPS